MQSISVIIPTLNERQNLERLLPLLRSQLRDGQIHLLVVDGGSTDGTVEYVESLGVPVERTVRGRAIQMNAGARMTDGEVLYFVHGDTLPPATFTQDISQAIAEGYALGCYRFAFDQPDTLLKINAYFTRFQRSWCRGGDQSLFIQRYVFEELGGFDESFVIMEDFDLMRRASGRYPFKIMPKDIVVSARKYRDNSYFRVQLANLVVYNMFRLRYPPPRILATYRKLIHYRS